MTYRRSGGFWSLVREIFTARAANRRRQPTSRQGRGREHAERYGAGSANDASAAPGTLTSSRLRW